MPQAPTVSVPGVAGHSSVSGKFGCRDQELVVCKVVEGVERGRSDTLTLVLSLYRELEGGCCGRLLPVKELGRAGGSLRTGPSHNEAHKQRY